MNLPFGPVPLMADILDAVDIWEMPEEAEPRLSLGRKLCADFFVVKAC